MPGNEQPETPQESAANLPEKVKQPAQQQQVNPLAGLPPLRANLQTQFNFDQVWDTLAKTISPEGYQQMIGQGPAPYLAEGFHPPESWARAFFNWQSRREQLGIKNVTGRDWEPIGQFVTSRLGYAPTYWEDPQRVAKWYHQLQSLPPGAPTPEWIDPARLTAAYKYFERRYEGQPWYTWKFLHPTDPARQFLQGFDMPPQELLRPEELIYRPGEAIAEAEADATVLTPGGPGWDEADLWRKVLSVVFGAGPTIGESFNLPGAGGSFDVGLSRFARGFAKAAPLGFGIGFFGGGGPLSPLSGLGFGLTAAGITGTAGGAAELGLGAIQERRELGQEVMLGTPFGEVAYDQALERLLIGLLGLLQYPVDLVERAGGTAQQAYLSLSDPDRYGPIEEVISGIRIEFPSVWTPSDVGPQGPLIPMLQIGGPTGEAAGLAFETAPTMNWIVNGLEHLSYNLDKIFYEGTEEITIAKPDEVWDLTSSVPRKIGPANLDTETAVWNWAVTDARRQLMQSDMAPRDARLIIAQQYGISGILSDLFLQAVLDPLNFAPMGEVRLARLAAAERPGVVGRLVRRVARIGDVEAGALRAALEHLPPGAGLNIEDLRHIRSAGELGGYFRAAMQTGGKDVIESFANILRTMDNFGQPEVISGMGRFARWLGGVNEEGKPIDLDEPTGFLGRIWGLTPKARAHSFLTKGADLFRLLLNYSDDPNAMRTMARRLTTVPGEVAQELGLRYLNSPDAHYPLLMLRDFQVEKLDPIVDVWNSTSRQRMVLSRLTELLGNETDTATITQLRDMGDGAWQRILDEVQSGIAQGDQAASDFYNLIQQGQISKALLQTDLKALIDGEIPYHPDHVRAQILDALLDHSTDWAIKNFNVKVENQVYRFSNALKQAASIVLLDGNPGYFFANFWNNVSTMAFDGVLGLKRKQTLYSWWYEFGMTPHKLLQAFGGPGQLTETGRAEIEALDLATAIEKGVEPQEWARVQAEAAASRGAQKLSTKARGEGPITALDRFFGGFRNKPGQKGIGRFSPLIFSRLSHAIEQWSSANDYTKGAQQWWARGWRRGRGITSMPPHVEQALGPDLANWIYGFVEGNLRYEAIENGLLGEAELQPRIEQFVEKATEGLIGKSAEDLLQILHETDAMEFLTSELEGAKSPDDVRVAFDAMDKRVQEHINSVHADEVKMIAAEVAEQVKAGDFTGMLDTWLNLQKRLEEWWTSHVLNWGRAVEEADTLANLGADDAADGLYATRMAEAKADAQRMMDMQTAVVDGMVDGMVEASEPGGANRGDFTKYTLGLRTQLAEWQRFFDLRDQLWTDYGQARKEGTLEPGQYQETYQRLSFEYDERIRDTIDLQEQMDQSVLDYVHRLNPEAAERLAPMLADIREHQLTMYQHEAAVRDAAYEVWGAKDGRAVAQILRRTFGDYPQLLLAFDQFIRQVARRGDLTTKDNVNLRRQIYEVWVDQVKIEHIRDYYLKRGRGLVEVLGGEVDPATDPPQVQPIERPTVDAEALGLEVEQTRIEELVAEGVQPDEAGRVAAEEVAAARVNVDLNQKVTLDELVRLAADAGIGTVTKQGRRSDAHLLNVLNKDMRLEGDAKLRRLEDLLTLGRQEGAEGDALVAARQHLVNRANTRLMRRQASRLTGMTVEALETLENGVDQVGVRKLRRIATDNGLTEADLMPKEHIWSWLEARARRLDPVPFNPATVESMMFDLARLVDTAAAPAEMVQTYQQIVEGLAAGAGMRVQDYVARRYGRGDSDAIYTFTQEIAPHEAAKFAEAKAEFGVARNITEVPVGFLLPDGSVVPMPVAHPNIGRIFGDPTGSSLRSVERFIELGAIRFRRTALGVLTGRYGDPGGITPSGMVAIEFTKFPSRANISALSRYIKNSGGNAVVDFHTPSGRMLASRVLRDARPIEIGKMWQEIREIGSQRFYQGAPEFNKPLYSHMSRIIETKMPERMPADQLFGLLRNSGVRLEELKWSLMGEIMAQRLGVEPEAVYEAYRTGGDLPGPAGDVTFTKTEARVISDFFEPLVQMKVLPVVEPRWSVADVEIEWKVNLEEQGVRDIEATVPLKDSQGDRSLWVRINQVDRLSQDPSPATLDMRVIDRNRVGGRDVPQTVYEPGRGNVTNYQREFATVEQAQAYVEQWGGILGQDVERTQYDQWTQPGGTNYREILVHLPPRDKIVGDLETELLRATGSDPTYGPQLAGYLDEEVMSNILARFKGDLISEAPEAIRLPIEQLRAWENLHGGERIFEGRRVPGTGLLDYQDPHWEHANTLAHTRVKDRILPDGSRVLFVEEIQSAQGQSIQLRRLEQQYWDAWSALEDYRSSLRNIRRRATEGKIGGAEVQAEFEALRKAIGDETELVNRVSRLQEKLDDAPGADRPIEITGAATRPVDMIPMPLEKTWHELVVKRLIRMAVDEGYDTIAFPDAEGVFFAETQRTPQQAGAIESDAREIYWVAETDWMPADRVDSLAIRRAEEAGIPVDRVTGEFIRQQEGRLPEGATLDTEFIRFGSRLEIRDAEGNVIREHPGVDRADADHIMEDYGLDLLEIESDRESYTFDELRQQGEYQFAIEEGVRYRQYKRMLRGFEAFYEKTIPSVVKKQVKAFGADTYWADVVTQVKGSVELQLEGGELVRFERRGEQGYAVYLRNDVDSEWVLNDQFRNLSQIEESFNFQFDDSQLQQLRSEYDTTAGFVVEINDEMRGRGGPEYRLFQESNETKIIQAELDARRSMVEVLRKAAFGQGSIERVLAGEPLIDVVGAEATLPPELRNRGIELVNTQERAQEMFARYGAPNSYVAPGVEALDAFGIRPGRIWVDDAAGGAIRGYEPPRVRVSEFPVEVLQAYDTWRTALQDTRWLDSQGKLFQDKPPQFSQQELEESVLIRIETLRKYEAEIAEVPPSDPEGFSARNWIAEEISEAEADLEHVRRTGRLPRNSTDLLRSGQLGTPEVQYQGPRASIELGRDGRAVIRALTNPDFDSGLHEIGHLMRLDLLPHEMETVTKWVRGNGIEVGLDRQTGRWTGEGEAPRQAEELWADGFVKYMREGVAPRPDMQPIFDKIKQWLIAVFRAIVGAEPNVKLNDDIRQIMADHLGARAPDFDIDEVTWQKIRADAELEGRPVIEDGGPPTVTRAPAPSLSEIEAQPRVELPGINTGLLTEGVAPDDPNITYQFRYRIMGLDDVMPSHTLSGKLTEGYPPDLQPRDRSRAASLRQSQDYAARLAPKSLLEPTRRIDDGTPIIDGQGHVLSGNARVNALRIAVRDFPENFKAYVNELRGWIGNQGRWDFQSDMPRNAILVRELVSDVSLPEFAQRANEPAVLSMSPAEQARADTRRLSQNLLASLDVTDPQTAQEAIMAAVNREFVRAFVKQLPRSEQGGVVTRSGELSARGLDRILQALFVYAWGDDAGTVRVAEMVFESTDPVIRNTTNAMMQAAADMAKMKALIEAGRRPDSLDITADFIAAVDRLARLKQEGTSIEDFVQQQALPGFGGELSEFQLELMLDLEQSKRSAKAIRELLKKYADLVERQPDIGQLGLMGETEYPSMAELYTMAKETNARPTDDQQILFQPPTARQPKLALDQIPPTLETAAKMSEGYQGIRPAIDALRDTMAGPDGWVRQPRMDSVRQRLDPNAQTDFTNWVKGLRGDMSSTKFSTMKWGERVRDFSLLDYTKQRGGDIGLGILSNYPFWPTRTIMRWLIRTGNFPMLMATYAKINEARRKMERGPGFPSRLQGKIHLPLPFLPEWMGGGLWVDPIRPFFPPHMFLDTFDRVALEQNRTTKRAAYIIEKWVEDGQVDRAQAREAIETHQGELWKLANDEARAQMEQEFQDPLDYIELLTGIALPWDIAREFARGTPERISPLPLTRYTKALTSALSQATGIGDPAGVNIEQPLRRMAGMPDWDRFEDYRFDRMLSNMVGDNPELLRDSLIAQTEQRGPLWDEAVRRVNSARNHGVYANPLWWVFGMGGDTFPTGEQSQRKLQEEFSRAYAARDVGDYEAVGKFWDKYPEYKARLASFNTPEEKMRFFLVDEVWVRYMELGSANKELVRLQLGEEFQDMFLSKETRSYPDIPLETLASWAQAIGGYVPENAENRIEYKDLLPDLLQLPPEAADVIDTFRQERNERYPNWFAVQQGYFAFPPGSDDRKRYAKAQWPWTLEDYWDWRRDEMDKSPLLESYYRRYDLENDEAGSLGTLRVPEILSNPILMRQLEANLYGGQGLTSGALEELRRIWESMGSPGEFNTWVEQLDLTQEPVGGAPPGRGY